MEVWVCYSRPWLLQSPLANPARRVASDSLAAMKAALQEQHFNLGGRTSPHMRTRMPAQHGIGGPRAWPGMVWGRLCKPRGSRGSGWSGRQSSLAPLSHPQPCAHPPTPQTANSETSQWPLLRPWHAPRPPSIPTLEHVPQAQPPPHHVVRPGAPWGGCSQGAELYGTILHGLCPCTHRTSHAHQGAQASEPAIAAGSVLG